MNLYQYVGGRAIHGIDPMGLAYCVEGVDKDAFGKMLVFDEDGTRRSDETILAEALAASAEIQQAQETLEAMQMGVAAVGVLGAAAVELVGPAVVAVAADAAVAAAAAVHGAVDSMIAWAATTVGLNTQTIGTATTVGGAVVQAVSDPDNMAAGSVASGPTAKEVYVIGENMADRVLPKAVEIGAKTINDDIPASAWRDKSQETLEAMQRAWAVQLWDRVRQGKVTVVDEGIDMARDARSRFYSIEKEVGEWYLHNDWSGPGE